MRILFPVPMGGFKDAQDEVLSLDDREFVRRYLADPIVTMESPHETTRCTSAVNKLNINPDGEVTPCVFVPLSYGNVRNQSLREIWKLMAEFDRIAKPEGKCPFSDMEFREKLFRKSQQTETNREEEA